MAGMEIDPGLADLLLSDLRACSDRRAAPDGEKAASYDVGRLPLLAHALRATWQQRHRSALTVTATGTPAASTMPSPKPPITSTRGLTPQGSARRS